MFCISAYVYKLLQIFIYSRIQMVNMQNVCQQLPVPIHTTSKRYFARQPIFDLHQRVFGYELLYRAGAGQDVCRMRDPELATGQIIDNILSYGPESLAGGATKVFLNCTEHTIVDGTAALLPARSVVLEVLEDIAPKDEVVQACRDLKQQGLEIALDDFAPRKGMGRLVELADYIKVDFRACDVKRRAEIYREIQGHHGSLLAEKIETAEEMHAAIDEGHMLFQGYFVGRPENRTKEQISTDKVNSLRVLALLRDPEFRWRDVEDAIKTSPMLTYRTLCLINSGLYTFWQAVTSVRKAITYLGMERVRSMVLLAAITGSSGMGDSGDIELLYLVLHRAYFCEALALYLSQDSEEQYLYGMLSALPLLLGMTMAEMVKRVPVRKGIESALLSGSTKEAAGLRIMLAYESGCWHEYEKRIKAANISHKTVGEVYLESSCRAQTALDTMIETEMLAPANQDDIAV